MPQLTEISTKRVPKLRRCLPAPFLGKIDACLPVGAEIAVDEAGAFAQGGVFRRCGMFSGGPDDVVRLVAGVEQAAAHVGIAVGAGIGHGGLHAAAATPGAALRGQVTSGHGAQPGHQIPGIVLTDELDAQTGGAFLGGLAAAQVFHQGLDVGIHVPGRDREALVLQALDRHDGAGTAADVQQQAALAFD